VQAVQSAVSKLSTISKCPKCKYVMCHVCRKDIRQEKYNHFCQHFRAIAGPCQQCSKCDLYRAQEDRDLALQAAKKASDEWRKRHPNANNLDFSLDSIGPTL
jgi:hypothetical protein